MLALHIVLNQFSLITHNKKCCQTTHVCIWQSLIFLLLTCSEIDHPPSLFYWIIGTHALIYLSATNVCLRRSNIFCRSPSPLVLVPFGYFTAQSAKPSTINFVQFVPEGQIITTKYCTKTLWIDPSKRLRILFYFELFSPMFPLRRPGKQRVKRKCSRTTRCLSDKLNWAVKCMHTVLKALFGEEICISEEGDYNNYTTPIKRRRNGGR